MEVKTNGRTVLWWEIAAFSLLIAVSWADELFGVPALLFGGSHQPNYREAGLETIVILLVAIPVVTRTRRVAARLFHLEGFLRVCAWCKKVRQDQALWQTAEAYIASHMHVNLSHSICPDCLEKQKLNGGARR